MLQQPPKLPSPLHSSGVQLPAPRTERAARYHEQGPAGHLADCAAVVHPHIDLYDLIGESCLGRDALGVEVCAEMMR